jgi:hypothetical protein
MIYVANSNNNNVITQFKNPYTVSTALLSMNSGKNMTAQDLGTSGIQQLLRIC